MTSTEENRETTLPEGRREENLLKSESFCSAPGSLKAVIGRTDSGEVIVRDVHDIPHMLVCGTTGSGKTSFVRTMLATICAYHSPDEVQLVICDSRGIEYDAFRHIPQMLVDVITRKEKAEVIIRFLLKESQDRLDAFAKAGVKDLDSYNRKKTDTPASTPVIIAVFDDYSLFDISKDVIPMLQNLLMNGRSVGIHMIVVTSVLTGRSLKDGLLSLIPCRICFRVGTKAESKTALGIYGAESLSVPGEIIYKYRDDFYRCQCTFAEYENIDLAMRDVTTSNISIQRLGMTATKIFDGYTPASDADMRDPYFEDAALLVVERQKASVGMLQRQYKIGFNRADRIMCLLEEAGIVGPENGAQPRQVLVTKDELWKD